MTPILEFSADLGPSAWRHKLLTCSDIWNFSKLSFYLIKCHCFIFWHLKRFYSNPSLHLDHCLGKSFTLVLFSLSWGEERFYNKGIPRYYHDSSKTYQTSTNDCTKDIRHAISDIAAFKVKYDIIFDSSTFYHISSLQDSLVC